MIYPLLNTKTNKNNKMRIELEPIQTSLNKIDKIVYLNGVPNKGFINSMDLPLMYESVVTSLLKTRSISYYLNSFKSNTDNVWLNIIIAKDNLGKEEFRIKFPEITTNICTLSLLRNSLINKKDPYIYTSQYYEHVYKQMERKVKNTRLDLAFINSPE
jgi:hypothetical protein